MLNEATINRAVLKCKDNSNRDNVHTLPLTAPTQLTSELELLRINIGKARSYSLAVRLWIFQNYIYLDKDIIVNKLAPLANEMIGCKKQALKIKEMNYLDCNCMQTFLEQMIKAISFCNDMIATGCGNIVKLANNLEQLIQALTLLCEETTKKLDGLLIKSKE